MSERLHTHRPEQAPPPPADDLFALMMDTSLEAGPSIGTSSFFAAHPVEISSYRELTENTPAGEDDLFALMMDTSLEVPSEAVSIENPLNAPAITVAETRKELDPEPEPVLLQNAMIDLDQSDVILPQHLLRQEGESDLELLMRMHTEHATEIVTMQTTLEEEYTEYLNERPYFVIDEHGCRVPLTKDEFRMLSDNLRVTNPAAYEQLMMMQMASGESSIFPTAPAQTGIRISDQQLAALNPEFAMQIAAGGCADGCGGSHESMMGGGSMYFEGGFFGTQFTSDTGHNHSIGESGITHYFCPKCKAVGHTHGEVKNCKCGATKTNLKIIKSQSDMRQVRMALAA